MGVRVMGVLRAQGGAWRVARLRRACCVSVLGEHPVKDKEHACEGGTEAGSIASTGPNTEFDHVYPYCTRRGTTRTAHAPPQAPIKAVLATPVSIFATRKELTATAQTDAGVMHACLHVRPAANLEEK
eukprot:1271351-Rhodomonas_salina.1